MASLHNQFLTVSLSSDRGHGVLVTAPDSEVHPTHCYPQLSALGNSWEKKMHPPQKNKPGAPTGWLLSGTPGNFCHAPAPQWESWKSGRPFGRERAIQTEFRLSPLQPRFSSNHSTLLHSIHVPLGNFPVCFGQPLTPDATTVFVFLCVFVCVCVCVCVCLFCFDFAVQVVYLCCPYFQLTASSVLNPGLHLSDKLRLLFIQKGGT